MTATREEKNYARRIVRHLVKGYPDAKCALYYESPFQLLIATILSAQCTDERVNIVTKKLFEKYPTAFDLAVATQSQIERIVKSAGFFRVKAKNIRGCASQLVEKFDGDPPQCLDDLVKLPGVGRKTANVLLGTEFGIAAGVVVDTHVGRISRRLGLTSETDAVKVERELMQVVAKKDWIYYSHRMIHHGRQVCDARKPLCEECSMKRFCPRIGIN